MKNKGGVPPRQTETNIVRDNASGGRKKFNSGMRTVSLLESNGTWMPIQNETRLPMRSDDLPESPEVGGKVGKFSKRGGRTDAEIDYEIDA